MAHQLLKALHDVASQHLRDHPILVWYDEGGTLSDLIGKATPRNASLIQYAGSYLALRAKVESEDPEFRRKWLIYVPERALEPSWIRDYELFGDRVDLDLERVLTEHFGLASSLQIRELLQGERGRALAANWEDVMKEAKPPITKRQIANGLLAVAFNLGPSFTLGRAILEYVTYPEVHGRELARLGLHEVFSEMIQTDLGLKLQQAASQVSAESLAAALLFSELTVHSKGLGSTEFQQLLPEGEKREVWANLAVEWLENTRLREGFLRWSSELEKKYNVRGKLAGLEALLNVMSFASVDETLLQELSTRLSSAVNTYSQQIETIREVVEARKRSPWARRGETNICEVIGTATELYSASKAGAAFLQEPVVGGLNDLVRRYTAEPDGWWRIDGMHLVLASQADKVDEQIWNTFVKPASQAYANWLRILTTRFSEAASKTPTWPVDGILKQERFWEEIAEGYTGSVAVLLIDALRYDLCRHLAQRVSQQGYKVEVRPMLASLPSITEVGMAALLPRDRRAIAASVTKGELRVSLEGNIPLNEKSDRKKWLEQTLGDEAVVLDLDDVNKLSKAALRSTVKEAGRVILMDRDIDLAGTFLSPISPRLFEEMVDRVATAVSKLHQAGMARVVVATDHGFLLLPEGCSIDTVEGMRAEEDVDKKRRYAIGKPPRVEALISFRLASLGLSGEGSAVFPRGLTILSTPGAPSSFLHGGLSPQETCVATVVSAAEAPPELGRVEVKAEIPETITAAIFLVTLTPIVKLDAGKPRSLRVEAYSGEEKVAESDTVTLHMEPRKARLVLRKIPLTIEVRVVDVDTREVVVRREVKVQTAGYAEEI